MRTITSYSCFEFVIVIADTIFNNEDLSVLKPVIYGWRYFNSFSLTDKNIRVEYEVKLMLEKYVYY